MIKLENKIQLKGSSSRRPRISNVYIFKHQGGYIIRGRVPLGKNIYLGSRKTLKAAKEYQKEIFQKAEMVPDSNGNMNTKPKNKNPYDRLHEQFAMDEDSTLPRPNYVHISNPKSYVVIIYYGHKKRKYLASFKNKQDAIDFKEYTEQHAFFNPTFIKNARRHDIPNFKEMEDKLLQLNSRSVSKICISFRERKTFASFDIIASYMNASGKQTTGYLGCIRDKNHFIEFKEKMFNKYDFVAGRR